jgi:hypothetical protein
MRRCTALLRGRVPHRRWSCHDEFMGTIRSWDVVVEIVEIIKSCRSGGLDS